MNRFGVFEEAPLAAIRPAGWLRRILEKQRDGLTGHIEAAGFPFDTCGWAGERVCAQSGSKWWPYEQTGYWVDGAIRCARLLNDTRLLKKSRKQIDYVLSHAGRDGYLGPKFLRDEQSGVSGAKLRWAHAVFFRAWMAEFSATGNRRLLAALRRHYLGDSFSYTDHRDVCNVEIMAWLYRQTGDRRLLQRALKAYEGFNRRWAGIDTALKNLLSKKRATEHGVTFNEMSKLGAILYMYTGRLRFLDAAVNAYRKLDRDQMLIDGIPSSSEHLRGQDPLDSHETCDIADYTWSVGYLLMATGRADYADKIERACFNAGLGAVRKDFRALQYLSCPNQIIADRRSNHNAFHRGEGLMSFRPNPFTECCPGAINRIIPNYVSRMWMTDGRGNLAAALYGPSEIRLQLGRTGTRVRVIQETEYPFSERVNFRIETPTPATFTFFLRIPAWCSGARVEVNDRRVTGRMRSGTFFKLRRTFRTGDRICLRLPMSIRISRWPGGGFGVERGPLVYSLKIKEHWRMDREDSKSSVAFPAWNVRPGSTWNYALCVGGRSGLTRVAIRRRGTSLDPWGAGHSPIELIVPARRVRGWSLLRLRRIQSYGHGPGDPKTLRGRFVLTPPLPDPRTLRSRLAKKIVPVTLVPYGRTHLRLTVFPKADLVE